MGPLTACIPPANHYLSPWGVFQMVYQYAALVISRNMAEIDHVRVKRHLIYATDGHK